MTEIEKMEILLSVTNCMAKIGGIMLKFSFKKAQKYGKSTFLLTSFKSLSVALASHSHQEIPQRAKCYTVFV